MRCLGIDHVVLWVSEVERSLLFYTEALGLEAEGVDAFRRGEISFPSVRVGDGLIDLVGTADPIHPVDHVALVIDQPVGETEAELKVAHLAYRGPFSRMGAVGRTMSVYVTDPDGHVLELKAAR